MGKKRDKITIGVVGSMFVLVCILVWVTPDKAYSLAERRNLKQMPAFDVKTIQNGQFMKEFENYNLDQFPLRDMFRSLKAITSLKTDNNDIYIADGVMGKMDYPLRKESLDYATSRFQNVYDMYLKENNCNVYLSIIPDKNYFFAEKNGYLAFDYGALVSTMVTQNENMAYIDIFPYLSGDEYYKTDTHWKQENLINVADYILMQMDNEVLTEYEKVELEEDFYGVYYGQASLPLKADKISYLTNDVIKQYRVFDGTADREMPVYDESRMTGKDPYELFLGGSLSFVTIANSAAENEKQLIVFRDSFGSSLAPLLAQGYAKTTLIDIRYIHPAMLKELVEFENADVLFIYSTMVLNHSETLKK